MVWIIILILLVVASIAIMRDHIYDVIMGVVVIFVMGMTTSFIILKDTLRYSLYNSICSLEQKNLKQVTCQQGNIEVIYDNGDIEYEFLTLDKNSTK